MRRAAEGRHIVVSLPVLVLRATMLPTRPARMAASVERLGRLLSLVVPSRRCSDLSRGR